eukprot:5774010-Amphidinium_carterae.1
MLSCVTLNMIVNSCGDALIAGSETNRLEKCPNQTDHFAFCPLWLEYSQSLVPKCKPSVLVHYADYMIGLLLPKGCDSTVPRQNGCSFPEVWWAGRGNPQHVTPVRPCSK